MRRNLPEVRPAGLSAQRAFCRNPSLLKLLKLLNGQSTNRALAALATLAAAPPQIAIPGAQPIGEPTSTSEPRSANTRAGLARDAAERFAFEDTVSHWLSAHPAPETPPDRCVHCGQPQRHKDVLLPMLAEGGHT